MNKYDLLTAKRREGGRERGLFIRRECPVTVVLLSIYAQSIHKLLYYTLFTGYGIVHRSTPVHTNTKCYPHILTDLKILVPDHERPVSALEIGRASCRERV